MKRNSWFTVGIILLAAASAGIAYQCNPRTEATPPPPRERVAKLFRIRDSKRNSKITYPGRIRPVKHAELFFRVSGPVIEQALGLGQSVKTGELLMRIDPRDYERQVEKLTHELEIQKAQNSLLNTEYLRMKKLVESNAASQATYDSAFSAKQASDAQVKMLETALKIAGDKLADTVLAAPFDGVISEIRIEKFEMARAEVPVVVLQGLRKLEIVVNIPEGNIPDISLYEGNQYNGQKFKVTFPGRGTREFQATFEEFRPAAAAESGTYELRLHMEQPEDFIVLPGMTAEVHGLPHMVRRDAGTIKVPFAAVIRRNSDSAVWVYDPANRAIRMRKVTPGKPEDGDFITVDNDSLKPGEFIVAAGGDWLTEETKIRPLNPEVLDENH